MSERAPIQHVSDVDLAALIEMARRAPPMTEEEARQQRIGFAYGNVALANPDITRWMVEAENDRRHGPGGPT